MGCPPRWLTILCYNTWFWGAMRKRGNSTNNGVNAIAVFLETFWYLILDQRCFAQILRVYYESSLLCPEWPQRPTIKENKTPKDMERHVLSCVYGHDIIRGMDWKVMTLDWWERMCNNWWVARIDLVASYWRTYIVTSASMIKCCHSVFYFHEYMI